MCLSRRTGCVGSESPSADGDFSLRLSKSLLRCELRAISSVVEHISYTDGVVGSIPSSPNMIPEELARHVQRQFGLQDLDPARLVYAAKTDQYRAEVWLDAVTHHPLGERNPWRKCHTENYWAYYLTLPEHKHALDLQELTKAQARLQAHCDEQHSGFSREPDWYEGSSSLQLSTCDQCLHLAVECKFAADREWHSRIKTTQ